MESRLAAIDAIRKLLGQHGLQINDIGLWELGESFACEALHCVERLGIDPALSNVDGGAVAMGHVPGMSGARMAGHALVEGKRRGARFVIAATSAAGGLGTAVLFEIA
jgi:acetyl-CoA C-acetyltransferase